MQSYPSSRSTSRARPANVSPVETNGNRLGANDVELGTPIGPESHPAIHVGRVALITGAASGIGFALAKQLAALGLRIVLADNNENDLQVAEQEVVKIAKRPNVIAKKIDVSNLEEVQKLRDQVYESFGEVNLLFNNAGIGIFGGALSNMENWRKLMDVNLFGVLNMVHTFVPGMIHNENPSVVVNTGSKQGITNPPGNAAYNATKAAVKILTENLAWELRNAGANCTAHLFVPGWVYTQLTGAPNQHGQGDKTAGASTAEETVAYMLDKLRDGKFYIICPDNETTEDLDRLRIKWAAGDLVEGRPALSRWHPDWKTGFEEYVQSGLSHFDQRRLEKERNFAKTPTIQGDNL